VCQKVCQKIEINWKNWENKKKDMIVERIELDDIVAKDRDRYNSNNHGERPDDYDFIITTSNLHHYIDKFRSNYKTFTIDDPYELNWMKQAYRISCQTGKFSSLYKEELEDFLNKYKYINKLFPSEGSFVRADNVSLKYGYYGNIPYTNLEQVIVSTVTSTMGHSPINDKTSSMIFYLFPYIKIDEDKEFRIFVHERKITAISQQHIYKKNIVANEKTVEEWCNIIVKYFNEVIRDKIVHVNSYVIDLAILEDNTPFFIEISCFGKEYAAGSACFHWLIDEDILYGRKDKIYFRYVV
jgi:hypothetical protein